MTGEDHGRRQGVELARAAHERGAQVTLVAANVALPAPAGVQVVPVESGEELREAVRAAAKDADAVVMAAAVADFRPVHVAAAKIKKEPGAAPAPIELVETVDILAELVRDPPQTGQVIVGFAAETEPDPARLLDLGRSKIARKGCDFLVVNNVGWATGFATDDNDVLVLNKAGDIVMEASGTKLSVADRILDATLTRA